MRKCFSFVQQESCFDTKLHCRETREQQQGVSDSDPVVFSP